MSRAETFSPPSLAQHFEPPDEYVGCFGWIVGYSADAPFLNDAAERFTRQTLGQRAYSGRIAMALLLDPSVTQISPTAAPGVAHLPLRPDAREFRLLHAKFALLAFRHETQPQSWILRLIVTTGNWTRQTLEESLDLAWRIDLSAEDIPRRGDLVRLACANIRATWDLLTWLWRRFDTRLLEVSGVASETVLARQRTEEWIGRACEVGRRTRPQVFDNREKSFLKQLPELVHHHGGDIARNYIALGSGFYEEAAKEGEIPSVLQSIVKTLQQSGQLTKRPEIDVFVNPKACQAVARAVPAFAKAGWTVRPAQPPKFLEAPARSLHAKFIFIANKRGNSPYCNSAWLYLGSGNLTGPGFGKAMSTHGANLEVGVVLAPESLHWETDRCVEPRQVLNNLLPVQWEVDAMDTPEVLEAGASMPEPETAFVPCPIAYLLWEPADEGGRLRAEAESMPLVEILDIDGQPCSRDGTGAVIWRGQRPREVEVRFTAAERLEHAIVPVVDALGRVAGTALPALGIDEAWAQLASFPMPPAEEELLLDELAGDEGNGGVEMSGNGAHAARYPIRQMMELIENIAAKQTEVAQLDWPTWCARLEQCLMQMKDSPVIDAFVEFRLNPLSPLWHPPFRPDFALTAATTEGANYERALARIETAWKVADFRKLGAAL